MPCPACVERGRPDHFSSDPKCAFETPVFSNDNWMCVTMSRLREIVDRNLIVYGVDLVVYNDDQNAAILPLSGGSFLVLGWYKQRGRTEYAGILNETKMELLTYKRAEEIINYYAKK